MSTRGSIAPDREAARRAADRERSRPPVSSDPRFEAVRRGQVGSAVPVSSPDGAPAFWLVPFELDGRACGVARVELTSAVSQIATFGSGPADRGAWPEASFFEHPPPGLVAQAAERHPTLESSTARLSYDGTPAKWGWRIDTRPGEFEDPPLSGQEGTVVFITPGGWYTRAVRRAAGANREG